jgi:hypothetical protein
LIGGRAFEHHGEFAGVVIASHGGLAARHLLPRRHVIPAVRAMIDGVEDQAFVREIALEIAAAAKQNLRIDL